MNTLFENQMDLFTKGFHTRHDIIDWRVGVRDLELNRMYDLKLKNGLHPLYINYHPYTKALSISSDMYAVCSVSGEWTPEWVENKLRESDTYNFPNDLIEDIME